MGDILNRLMAVWIETPELRLCQLIVNATCLDPYYIEDDDSLKKLDKLKENQ